MKTMPVNSGALVMNLISPFEREGFGSVVARLVSKAEKNAIAAT
jgi:hypothetical protein